MNHDAKTWRKIKQALFQILILCCLLPLLASAGVEQISEQEFRTLAAELAPKVNLFRDIWSRDPEAEFYGGTSRDFLYWLKGQFVEAHSPKEAMALAERLRELPVIDVKSFIIGDSDIDVVTKKPMSLSTSRDAPASAV